MRRLDFQEFDNERSGLQEKIKGTFEEGLSKNKRVKSGIAFFQKYCTPEIMQSIIGTV